MSLTQPATIAHGKPPQRERSVQLLAAVLGVLPLYSILIVLQVRGGLAVTIEGFTFYLAVISPASILVVFLLLRFLCGESLRDLNLKAGRVSRDLLATLVLSVVIIVASVISNYFLARLLPDSASNSSVTNLFRELAGDPRLLAVFAGPLLFLGAASEEVVRAFLLGRHKRAAGRCVRRDGAVEERSQELPASGRPSRGRHTKQECSQMVSVPPDIVTKLPRASVRHSSRNPGGIVMRKTVLSVLAIGLVLCAFASAQQRETVKIYFTVGQAGWSIGGKQLWRCNSDGSDAELLYRGSELGGVAVDADAGKLLFVEGDDLLCADLDGSGVSPMQLAYWLPQQASTAGYSAVDASSGYICWACAGDRIYCQSDASAPLTPVFVSDIAGMIPSPVVVDVAVAVIDASPVESTSWGAIKSAFR